MAVLLTMMHTGLLGALLTFGNTSFYGPERDVQDQQLAGLLMWVPGGLVYLAAGAWICWRWLSRIWAPPAAEHRRREPLSLTASLIRPCPAQPQSSPRGRASHSQAPPRRTFSRGRREKHALSLAPTPPARACTITALNI